MPSFTALSWTVSSWNFFGLNLLRERVAVHSAILPLYHVFGVGKHCSRALCGAVAASTFSFAGVHPIVRAGRGRIIETCFCGDAMRGLQEGRVGGGVQV